MVAIILCVFFGTAIVLVRHRADATAAPCGGQCNVILIVIDTLGAKHIAHYGYDRDTMPETTAFFQERGQIFEHVTSGASWTFPSFAAMYFSDLPSHITFADYMGQTNRPQLFSTLRSHGVAVRGIHLHNDPVTGIFIDDAVYGLLRETERPFHIMPGSRGGPATGWEKTRAALKETSDAANHMATSTGYFSFTHMHSVHTPYAPEPPYDHLFASSTGKRVITIDDILVANAAEPDASSSTVELFELRYDQSIAQTDALLGDFLRSLSTTTLAHTAIIITADHGEAFGAHGTLFHGFSVYRNETRVPLFVYIPSMPSREIDTPVSLLDLAPTILDLEGLPPESAFKGSSLVPLMRGEGRRTVVIQAENGYPFFLKSDAVKPGVRPPATLQKAIGTSSPAQEIISVDDWSGRIGSYKLIAAKSSTSTAVSFGFYDLNADPEELHDILHSVKVPAVDAILLRLMNTFTIERAQHVL